MAGPWRGSSSRASTCGRSPSRPRRARCRRASRRTRWRTRCGRPRPRSGWPEDALTVHDFEVRTFPAARQEILELLIEVARELRARRRCCCRRSGDIHQDHATIAAEGLRAFKRTTVLGYEIPWNSSASTSRPTCARGAPPRRQGPRRSRCYASQQHRNYANEEYIRNLARDPRHRDRRGRTPSASRSSAGCLRCAEPLRVLVTATGSPGAARLVRALRENGERPLRVVGTDMSDGSAGRFLCDAFHVVPPGSSDVFAPTLAELAEREGVDCVFPQSSSEVLRSPQARQRFPMPVLGRRRRGDRAPAATSPPPSTAAEQAGVRAPGDAAGRTPDEFRAAAEELGYPGRRRLHEAAGRQGLARLPHPLGVRRPPATRCSRRGPGRSRWRSTRRSRPSATDDFPPLLVMELATGPEHTVDGICRDGRLVLGHAKTREAMRAGLAMYFETVDRPDARRRGRRLAARDRTRLVRQRPVHRRPPARDQPAHLDDRLPGRPEPAVPRRPPCGRRALAGRARRATSAACAASRGARFATTTRSSRTTETRCSLRRPALPADCSPRPAVARLRPRQRGGALRLAAPPAALHALPDAGRLRPGRDAHGARRRGGHDRAARDGELPVPLRARAARARREPR